MREHPRTEPAEAVTATRQLERLARKHGLTVEALLAHARAEASARRGRGSGSLLWDVASGARRGREWQDYVNPPPADWFETSAAQDGPQREGVTTITIATGLARMRSYRWDGEKFPKPKIGKNYWFLFRTVAIDGLKDLMAHLKTATPFEYIILGEPIADTPHQGKRRLAAKSNGALITIRGVPRPYLICNCDSLPNLEGVDVSKLTPAQIHRYAVADLPKEFKGRLRDVLLGLARHQPRQSEGAPVVLAFQADRQRAPQALAGSDQRPRRARAGTEDSRVVDPLVGQFFSRSLRGAGIPRRRRSGAGTLAFHRRHDARRAGAGGEELENFTRANAAAGTDPGAAVPGARPAAGAGSSNTWAARTARLPRADENGGWTVRPAVRRRLRSGAVL